MKKTYVTTVIISIIAFIAGFMLFYLSIYENQVENALETDTVIETASVEVSEEEAHSDTLLEEMPLKEEVIYIVPSTQVTMRLMDSNNKTIEEEKLANTPFLGMTEEAITTYFQDCIVEQFDEKEVVLSKVFEVNTVISRYYLCVQEGMIGVVEKGEETTFISLNLSEDNLSKADVEKLKGEGILITQKQVQQLAEEPYYIEYILQSYSE